MSSKAFFKSSVAPELCYKSVQNKRRSIEIWLTTCIVTNFGRQRADCTVLVNPSNPQLSGVKNFPYFPRGGPVPKEKPMSMHKDWQPLGFVSQWGGMEVGSGMMYPVSVIDGLVHQHGGWKLQAECKWKQTIAGSGEDACPEGSAVMTTSGGLKDEYDAIVHTTPPFYKYDDNPEELLGQCYQNAFASAFREHCRIATPLIGSGARGFPKDVAICIAAEESLRWRANNEDDGVSSECANDDLVVAFALLEKELVEDLIAAIEASEDPRIQ